jgi:protein-tyrosine phosphatase
MRSTLNLKVTGPIPVRPTHWGGVAVTRDRHLEWQGAFNVRDLGGLRTLDGRATRFGAVVRGDAPDRLAEAGWNALLDHGIRTIIDLRNDDEREPASAPRPATVNTVRVPLDGDKDREFWKNGWERDPQFATPMYYGSHFERFPERTARVIAAIANAQPGGVYFHCVGGRDRSGQIAILLLALAGVEPSEIVADYELSAPRLARLYEAWGQPDQGPELAEFLAREGTSARELILSLLESFDAEAYLRSAGLGNAEIAAVRTRLLGPDSA